jgi:hypothetical protein
MDIQAIFENMRKDSSLLANLDIGEILKNMEKSDYLEGRTLQDILEEKNTVLEGLDIKKETQENMIEKLTDYRYIKNIYELHKGKHIRWIKIKDYPTVLNKGAILSDIKFNDKGTYLQCLRYDQKVFQIKMDEHIIFQKMNVEELLLLTINDKIKHDKLYTS